MFDVQNYGFYRADNENYKIICSTSVTSAQSLLLRIEKEKVKAAASSSGDFGDRKNSSSGRRRRSGADLQRCSSRGLISPPTPTAHRSNLKAASLPGEEGSFRSDGVLQSAPAILQPTHAPRKRHQAPAAANTVRARRISTSDGFTLYRASLSRGRCGAKTAKTDRVISAGWGVPGLCVITSVPQLSARSCGLYLSGTSAMSLPRTLGELQLYRVLQRANLLCYYDTFIQQGGDDVQQLCEAAEEEFLEIMALVGMATKPLHVRRLQKALRDWASNPALFSQPVSSVPLGTLPMFKVDGTGARAGKSLSNGQPGSPGEREDRACLTPMHSGSPRSPCSQPSPQPPDSHYRDKLSPMDPHWLCPDQDTNNCPSGPDEDAPSPPLLLSVCPPGPSASPSSSSCSAWTGAQLDPDTTKAVIETVDRLLRTLPRSDPTEVKTLLRMNKKMAKVVGHIFKMGAQDVNKEEEIRKYSLIYGRFDSKRREGKQLTHHELIINEAAAQFCIRDNALLLRRVELFSWLDKSPENVPTPPPSNTPDVGSQCNKSPSPRPHNDSSNHASWSRHLMQQTLMDEGLRLARMVSHDRAVKNSLVPEGNHTTAEPCLFRTSAVVTVRRRKPGVGERGGGGQREERKCSVGGVLWRPLPVTEALTRERKRREREGERRREREGERRREEKEREEEGEERKRERRRERRRRERKEREEREGGRERREKERKRRRREEREEERGEREEERRRREKEGEERRGEERKEGRREEGGRERRRREKEREEERGGKEGERRRRRRGRRRGKEREEREEREERREMRESERENRERRGEREREKERGEKEGGREREREREGERREGAEKEKEREQEGGREEREKERQGERGEREEEKEKERENERERGREEE
ncbi:hypothetical protein WMY93_011401 [Mugilogobius chulae]|uniref:Uncharacterized protein n=1 Tax=Mugilogobius chulae TaxID=88201 RepID=A0AAW0P2R8_9GOBI